MSDLKSCRGRVDDKVNNQTPAARIRGKKIIKNTPARGMPKTRLAVLSPRRLNRLATISRRLSLPKTIDQKKGTLKATHEGRTQRNKRTNTGASKNIKQESQCSTNTSALFNYLAQSPCETADVNVPSLSVIEGNIDPSALTLGFLGLGTIGSTIVKNLIYSGYKVVVWNRTTYKMQPLIRAGAVAAKTPMAVVEKADVTFCCVSEPHASKDLVFGKYGVLQVKNLRNKAYVELSTLDPDTSQEIGAAITRSNGRYLEAQMTGTRQNSHDGTLTILVAGDRTVFDECKMIFKIFAKLTIYLDAEVGKACKYHLIFQVMHSTCMAGLAEALALAENSGIVLSDILNIFQISAMNSPFLLSKCKEMVNKDFKAKQTVVDMQKNVCFALQMADSVELSMPITRITNEQFKHVQYFGYGDYDSSVVFLNSQI